MSAKNTYYGLEGTFWFNRKTKEINPEVFDLILQKLTCRKRVLVEKIAGEVNFVAPATKLQLVNVVVIMSYLEIILQKLFNSLDCLFITVNFVIFVLIRKIKNSMKVHEIIVKVLKFT